MLGVGVIQILFFIQILYENFMKFYNQLFKFEIDMIWWVVLHLIEAEVGVVDAKRANGACDGAGGRGGGAGVDLLRVRGGEEER